MSQGRKGHLQEENPQRKAREQSYLKGKSWSSSPTDASERRLAVCNGRVQAPAGRRGGCRKAMRRGARRSRRQAAARARLGAGDPRLPLGDPRASPPSRRRRRAAALGRRGRRLGCSLMSVPASGSAGRERASGAQRSRASASAPRRTDPSASAEPPRPPLAQLAPCHGPR